MIARDHTARNRQLAEQLEEVVDVRSFGPHVLVRSNVVDKVAAEDDQIQFAPRGQVVDLPNEASKQPIGVQEFAPEFRAVALEGGVDRVPDRCDMKVTGEREREPIAWGAGVDRHAVVAKDRLAVSKRVGVEAARIGGRCDAGERQTEPQQASGGRIPESEGRADFDGRSARVERFDRLQGGFNRRGPDGRRQVQRRGPGAHVSVAVGGADDEFERVSVARGEVGQARGGVEHGRCEHRGLIEG